MIESMVLLILGIAAFALFAVVFLAILVFKGLAKLLLLPITLAAGLLKLLVLGIAAVFLLALLPLGLAIAVFAIPALLVVGLVSATRSLITA